MHSQNTGIWDSYSCWDFMYRMQKKPCLSICQTQAKAWQKEIIPLDLQLHLRPGSKSKETVYLQNVFFSWNTLDLQPIATEDAIGWNCLAYISKLIPFLEIHYFQSFCLVFLAYSFSQYTNWTWHFLTRVYLIPVFESVFWNSFLYLFGKWF